MNNLGKVELFYCRWCDGRSYQELPLLKMCRKVVAGFDETATAHQCGR